MNANVGLLNRIFSGLTAFCMMGSLMLFPTDTRPLDGVSASYIVQAAITVQANQAVLNCGGQVTSQLDIINSVGASFLSTQLSCVQSQPGVQSVTPNLGVQSTGDRDGNQGDRPGDNPGSDRGNQPGNNNNGNPGSDRGGYQNNRAPATDYPDVTGANLVWTKGHDTGKNVTVAVVDTGVDLHTGLDHDRVIAWYDFVDGKKQPFDPNGHGTHISGIIANDELGADGEPNGMAPGVKLVEARVLKEDGSGTYENVIKGIQWVIQNKNKYQIRVMNLSLVSPAQSAYWADPLDRAVTAAWASGITVVVAAGNGGPGAMTIAVPGNNPYVITAGAFTDNYTPLNFADDYIAPFSAAGPTLDGFTKPDVIAPGAHMVSTMSNSSYVAKNHDANRIKGDYFSMAGTSQASAVTSGVAALVIAAHPELTPDQVKYRIMASALPWMTLNPDKAIYSIWQQGHGRINAPDAVYADLNGKANLGMDIKADLANKIHYEGYSYFDKDSSLFRLRGDYANLMGGYGDWDGSYTPNTGAIGAWSGAIGAWSGAIGAWSGAIGAWSGAIGAWSGAIGAWSGAIGAWSGAIGAWSGAIGAWSGGYTTWAGGTKAWTGSEPWANLGFARPGFVASFTAGAPVNQAMTISTCQWVEEP
jgi:serine protease AprX